MALNFISEPLTPVGVAFDTAGMAQGMPGVPQVFRWRGREWVVSEVLETWKEHGDCTHGSGERYVRKHGFRLRTADGAVFKVYFQRHFGRAKQGVRWWIQSMEEDGG